MRKYLLPTVLAALFFGIAYGLLANSDLDYQAARPHASSLIKLIAAHAGVYLIAGLSGGLVCVGMIIGRIGYRGE